jgi:HEAT repeat protein
MDASRIPGLIAAMDTTRTTDHDTAWADLRELGVDVVPHLASAFSSFRTWQGRVSLVFHSIRYARVSDAAFQLGLRGLEDKSYMVRWRACGLLAYSLRKDALAKLQPLLQHADARTREDARAAIDAIEKRNHHLYVDRDHSGRARWVVNEGDAA